MGATVLEAHRTAPADAPVRTLRDWHDEVRARQRRGDLDGAIDLLRRLIEVAPAATVTRLRRDLVVLLRLADQHVEADRLTVAIDPTDAPAWARLSRHARQTKDTALCVTAAIGWEAAAPDDPVVAHLAAVARSIRNGSDHARASDGYLREVFDHYADRFDTHLAGLGYRGPQAIAALVNGLIDDGDLAAEAAIADLGCGTGLVGHHLRASTTAGSAPPWSGRLTGVDLSPNMLERTIGRRLDDRPIYDEVVETDLVSFLADRPDAFDAVVAVDTFIYLGDLRPAFAATMEALRPGGWLIATVEHASEGQAVDRGYVPDVTGRYLHDSGWLEAELARSGFDLIIVDDLSVREELRRPVPGLVIVARRPAASTSSPGAATRSSISDRGVGRGPGRSAAS